VHFRLYTFFGLLSALLSLASIATGSENSSADEEVRAINWTSFAGQPKQTAALKLCEDMLLKSPKQWLKGFNLKHDGTVINHGLVHCDYMACIANSQMQGFLVFSLAQVPVSQTTDFNFEVVYRTLVERRFDHPPFEEPGGTMYIPGQADLYDPKGTDWSRFRYDIFYNMDTYMAVLNYDEELAGLASEWMQIRGNRILDMQNRHKDGRIYAPGEFDRYMGREQLALWTLSDAYLLQWLAAHDALSAKGNWFAQ